MKSTHKLSLIRFLLLGVIIFLGCISNPAKAQVTTLLTSGFEAADPTFTYTLTTGASCAISTTTPRTGTN